MIDLKPCPFCGSEAKLDFAEGRYFVQCTDLKFCGAIIRGKTYTDSSVVVVAWNQRSKQ